MFLADRSRSFDGRTAQGLFVCLEGIDGAGKTTAAHRSVAELQNRGVPALVFDKRDNSFGSPYVRRHILQLRQLIWEHAADDPYLELGDMHWIYLQAAWYAAVANCAVTPMLAAGRVVVTDTWTYKFLAKLTMRPDVHFAVATTFGDLPQPDLVIRLDIDPETAAARKTTFGISEVGNHEGDVALTQAGFVSYQRRLAKVFDAWTVEHGWTTLNVNGMSAPEVAETVATLILSTRDARPAVLIPTDTPER